MRFAVVALIMTPAVVIPAEANAVTTHCGTSGGHTLCVTSPDSPLAGEEPVTVDNTPNSGLVIATWTPSGVSDIQLIQTYAPSPLPPTDYSFIWPTEKYLDASGVLSVQLGTGGARVSIPVTLNNGNTTDFQHNPLDWMTYVPSWDGLGDPTILAVGDGPSNEAASNAVANRIAALHPPLFLFLGDVYENATYTEFRNHYGLSNIDDPDGQGTLWGAVADTTQPTLGNHEKVNATNYQDYWHGRPLHTSFTFGGVLFLDLNSSTNMTAGKAEYNYAKGVLTDPNAPPCIITYFHEPAVTSNTTIASNESDMWKLLANNGVDLVVNGHQHHEVEYKPLDANFNAGTPDSHLVELVAGAGGHVLAGVSGVQPGARVAWSQGKKTGLLAMTLNGAGNGNTTSIGWQWQDLDGTVHHPGSVDCGAAGNHAPVVSAGPDQAIQLPAQATLQGSVTDDGLPNGTLTSAWSKLSGPGTATFADLNSPSTTVSFSDPGTYVLRLTGTDSALQSSDDVSVTVLPEGTVTLTIPISVSSDDAEESAGTVARTNPNLKIVLRAGVNQTVGLRFTGLSIPPSSTIQNAYIQFQCYAATTGAASLTIEGQAADNPVTFARITSDISSRPRTSADVGWIPAAWPTVGAKGPDQQTPNLTSVVQEIVNRAGWASGNAMAFIITGTGVRTAESFDDGVFAPVLHIEYS